MKCVCPMGGDRTCPDDCLLAVWANLPANDRKTRRKPIAEQLYKQGFTQEQIATQLGVSQWTISQDLMGLEVASKPPRPKGGRPPGKRSAPKPPETKAKHEKIVALADGGTPTKDIAAAIGVGQRMVDRVLEVENARREGPEPEIERTALSMSAQEKLDAAIRQHQRKLDAQFERRVLDEVRKRVDEMILPHWKKQINEAQQLYARRRGLMDKATFNKIRRGLHPDSRNAISDKVLSEAFDTFMGLEKFLLNEKDSPTEVGAGLPGSWAEWEAAKQHAAAARRTKRHANPMRRQ